jgi:hypothetical protein
MRKLILVSLFALTCIHMQSQITITTADMPQVNDSIKISMCTSIGTLNPALTDTNYVWDYSTLIPTNQTVEHFDNPANFAFPFNLLFNIYNTSYGLFNYTPDSIPGLNIKLSKSYDFYKNSATDLKLIGKGIFINGLPANAPYSADDYVYQFPEQYTKVDSCDYKYGTKIPGQGYYGQKGHRVNTADGWGTVKTPYGTFQALRIKSLLTIIDTIYLDTYHIGFNRPRPLTIQYKWYWKLMGHPQMGCLPPPTQPTVTVQELVYPKQVFWNGAPLCHEFKPIPILRVLLFCLISKTARPITYRWWM